MASILAAAAEQRLARSGCVAVQIEPRDCSFLGHCENLTDGESEPVREGTSAGINLRSATNFANVCGAGTCLAAQLVKVRLVESGLTASASTFS